MGDVFQSTFSVTSLWIPGSETTQWSYRRHVNISKVWQTTLLCWGVCRYFNKPDTIELLIKSGGIKDFARVLVSFSHLLATLGSCGNCLHLSVSLSFVFFPGHVWEASETKAWLSIWFGGHPQDFKRTVARFQEDCVSLNFSCSHSKFKPWNARNKVITSEQCEVFGGGKRSVPIDGFWDGPCWVPLPAGTAHQQATRDTKLLGPFLPLINVWLMKQQICNPVSALSCELVWLLSPKEELERYEKVPVCEACK